LSIEARPREAEPPAPTPRAPHGRTERHGTRTRASRVHSCTGHCLFRPTLCTSGREHASSKPQSAVAIGAVAQLLPPVQQQAHKHTPAYETRATTRAQSGHASPRLNCVSNRPAAHRSRCLPSLAKAVTDNRIHHAAMVVYSRIHHAAMHTPGPCGWLCRIVATCTHEAPSSKTLDLTDCIARPASPRIGYACCPHQRCGKMAWEAKHWGFVEGPSHVRKLMSRRRLGPVSLSRKPRA